MATRNPQTTSPLFALPREVRDIIYNHTASVGRNHEDQFGGGPTDVAAVKIKRCAWEDNADPTRPRFSHSAVWVRRGRPRFPGTRFLFGHTIWMSGMGDVLRLVLTCRLAYEEAWHLLYTAAPFYFGGIPRLYAFRSRLAPRAACMIRSVHVRVLWPPQPDAGSSTASPDDDDDGEQRRANFGLLAHEITALSGLRRLTIALENPDSLDNLEDVVSDEGMRQLPDEIAKPLRDACEEKKVALVVTYCA